VRKQKQHEQADLEQFISNFHFGTKRKDIINLPSGEIGGKGEATIAKNIYRQNRSWHNNNQPPQAHPLLPAKTHPLTHPHTHRRTGRSWHHNPFASQTMWAATGRSFWWVGQRLPASHQLQPSTTDDRASDCLISLENS